MRSNGIFYQCFEGSGALQGEIRTPVERATQALNSSLAIPGNQMCTSEGRARQSVQVHQTLFGKLL